ncbi:hypothetical protein, partial [Anaerosolibacter sp.]|uniref:hypothetical protein n=1 Tax=Anaerosolibacter sp. TaxID=1872527 RepID=UPI0039EE49D6
SVHFYLAKTVHFSLAVTIRNKKNFKCLVVNGKIMRILTLMTTKLFSVRAYYKKQETPPIKSLVSPAF